MYLMILLKVLRAEREASHMQGLPMRAVLIGRCFLKPWKQTTKLFLLSFIDDLKNCFTSTQTFKTCYW